jgi:hypothetical protein
MDYNKKLIILTASSLTGRDNKQITVPHPIGLGLLWIGYRWNPSAEDIINAAFVVDHIICRYRGDFSIFAIAKGEAE